jgi:HK97 family phage major capsid protein
MSAIIEAKSAIRRLATKGQDIAADATLTMAEKKTALEAIAADVKSFQDVVSLHEQANRLMEGGETAPEAARTGYKSIGDQIVGSDAFSGAVNAKGTRFSYATEIGTKAANVAEGTTISNGQLAGNGGVLALPNYLPGIVDIRYAALGVGDLFAQGATDSPIISYVKQSAQTLGGAATAEGAAFGQSDATFARVNEQVGKVTALFKITDEMLQDTAQAESFLSNMLVKELMREEENEILNGTGYPAINGILGRSGLQTAQSVTTGTIATPSKLADAIFSQITAIRTGAFVEPDAVVVNPADWAYLKTAKDANGQYYIGGGPFGSTYGVGGQSNVDSIWGLKVVQSPRIAAGTALVGGFQEAGQLFRRQGITVEMTNSNEDDFKKNLVTVRATSRSALAVYRPGAFGKVNVTWA